MMVRHALAGLVLSLAMTPAAAQETVRIVIDKYRFEPQAVTVKLGTVVEWVNAEKRTSHSVLVDGEQESERLFPGDSHRQRFDRTGHFAYRCGPHPEMVGTIEAVP
jgi:plastocyanin